MKFGLQLFTDYSERSTGIWPLVRAQAEAAEASGFDGVFVPTDISWRRLDALSLVAALASVTERVIVGTNIITLPLYAPLHVAEAIATADIIAGGRVLLGVAAGWRADEFAAAGVPFASRVGRHTEAMDLLRRLWTEPIVTFPGRYYRVERVALDLKPVQRPHPPIWLGAHARPAIERAGRAGLVWIEGPRTSLPRYVEKLGWYRCALAQSGHQLGELPLMREAFVAESSAEARREIEGPLLSKYAEYARQAGMPVGSLDQEFGPLARGRLIVGSVEECRAAVAE